MKHYIEITLLPNPDIHLFGLWTKVFQQIHLGLVEIQDDQGRVPIGVSFPEYVTGEKYSVLGDKLRVFSDNEATLSQFNATKWLSRLSDYVHCTRIRPVPEKVLGYAIYQREQPKTNKERLARRYASRHNENYDAALLHYSDMQPKAITTPFIRLKSLSGGQVFCVWIKKSLVSASCGGTYSRYGLSSATSVPEF
jgi:CRISPR-associated endonuclease Csy4